MKKLVVVAVALITAWSAALAGPKEDAMSVVEKWAKAFTESDVDTIVKLYSADALFIGTGSQMVVTKPDGIRSYFEKALLSNRPHTASIGDSSTLVLSDTSVVIAGLDTVTGVRDGSPYSLNGRVTFVVAKRADGWQIVHFHRSAKPN